MDVMDNLANTLLNALGAYSSMPMVFAIAIVLAALSILENDHEE